MDENNVKEPISSEPVTDQKPDAPTDASTKTMPPSEPAKAKKTSTPLIIAVVVLLIAIIGVVAYILFSQPKSDNNQNIPTTSQTDEKPEVEAVETDIEDQTIISALFQRLLTLHVPRSKSYLEYTKNYEANKHFEFRAAYTPAEKIYPDASELENKDKLYIVTSYLKDQGEFEPIANFDIPSDFFATTFPEYCTNTTVDPVCSGSEGYAVSEEKVVSTFLEFFGTNPTLENPTPICGGAMYNSEYKIFHDTVGGCGGVDNLNHQLYISKYTEKGELAYIYASLDSIYEDYDPSGTTSVYRAFLKHTDFWDPDTQQTLTPDSSLLHEESLGMTEYGMYITAENYTYFDQYRFTFEKDDDGNYFFKTVEKL